MAHMAVKSSSGDSSAWSNRLLLKRYPKRVRLDAAFAGIPAGATLFVGTPDILKAYIQKIPSGQTRTLQRLRRDLSRAHRCQAMCPVSTAIFLRMLAESAWDELSTGRPVRDVTPFWRVIEPGSTIAKRLRTPDTWLRAQLASEAGSPQA
jgi:hypothetical protein